MIVHDVSCTNDGLDSENRPSYDAFMGRIYLDNDDCQAKLLRVLQEGEVVPVGARQAVPVDVRIVAATNRRVTARSDEPGPLRPDLVHRLSGWAVTLPPLRDRGEDLPQLAAHFLADGARRAGRSPGGISRSALDAMLAHDWPGNVRELEQEMHRAALFLDERELLSPRHLSPEIAATVPQPEPLEAVSAEAERKAIETALAGQDGNATRAAEVLGMEARVGRPMGLSGGLVEEVSDPKYSTGVGLVLYGMRHDIIGGSSLSDEAHASQNGTAHGDTLMTRIADRMKSWFDEL